MKSNMNDAATQPATNMRLLIFVLASNEEHQLEKTVRGLQAQCPPEHAAGIVLFLAPKATVGCLRTAAALQDLTAPIPTEILQETTLNTPETIKKAVRARTDATHVLFLASDYFLETSQIVDLIERAARDPEHIYKFSRALPGGRFQPGYPIGAIPLYRLFSFFVRILYGVKITDPVFPVMVAPVQLFQQQYAQSSILAGAEFIFLLLRMKLPMIEVPAFHLPRTEKKGTTNIAFRLRYLGIALRTRFAKERKDDC